MLDARVVAKGIMYGKQRRFEYKYKTGKYLAYLLSGTSGHRSVIKKTKRHDGTWTLHSEDKLQHVFFKYYVKLYISSSPWTEEVNEVLTNLPLPQLNVEDKDYLDEPIDIYQK